MAKANYTYGVTMQEANQAFSTLTKSLPSLGENEINLIKHNPSLSFNEKMQLIRFIRKR